MNRQLLNIVTLFTLCIGSFSNEKQWEDKAKQGIAYQKEGRCAHAIKLFKEVVKTKPHWYSLYNRIAECFKQLQYDEIAMKYYRKTLLYDPKNSRSISELEKYLQLKKSKTVPKVIKSQKINQQKFFNVSEIQQMRKRLWFLRDGKLMTSLIDGRDLRQYSPIVYSEVFPNRGSKNGFPVLMQEEDNAPNVMFYLFPDEGTMIRLTGDGYDCHLPLYLPQNNEILFLARKVSSSTSNSSEMSKKYVYGVTYSLYGIDLEDGVFKEVPRTYLENFYTISGLEKGTGDEIYLVGKRTANALSKVFLWRDRQDLVQIGLGVGDVQRIQKSPDGSKLICLTRGPDENYSILVNDLESEESFALTSIRAKRMTASWHPDSKNIIFASSNPGLKDRWQTNIYSVRIPQLSISKLFGSNFLYKDFSFDENGEMLYFLSNYDNNYEVYRFNLQTQSQERLTISTHDETRLGFWTFSGI